jgi:hypothetical protein
MSNLSLKPSYAKLEKPQAPEPKAEPKAESKAESKGEPKGIYLRARVYDIVDPTSGVRVYSDRDTKVLHISPYLRAQINIGLVKIVE